MGEQKEFDFTHSEENNGESQAHLNKNRKGFNKNCLRVLNWLYEGKRLKVLDCANEGVASLPRRIADLKDRGIEISDQWEGNVKVYYMTVEQVETNKKDEASKKIKN